MPATSTTANPKNPKALRSSNEDRDVVQPTTYLLYIDGSAADVGVRDDIRLKGAVTKGPGNSQAALRWRGRKRLSYLRD